MLTTQISFPRSGKVNIPQIKIVFKLNDWNSVVINLQSSSLTVPPWRSPLKPVFFVFINKQHFYGTDREGSGNRASWKQMEPRVFLKGTIGGQRKCPEQCYSWFNGQATSVQRVNQLHQKLKMTSTWFQIEPLIKVLPNDTLPFQRKQKRRLEMWQH